MLRSSTTVSGVLLSSLHYSKRYATSEAEAADNSAEGKTRPRYHRRSSDPHTLRERMDFRRDHNYGRHRPLPDVPWRQDKKHKTYLDDAERLYGRKETWSQVEDEVLREKLVSILQDYLRDTLSASSLEIRDARKYQQLCITAAKEYKAHVTAGAFSSPEMLRDWAEAVIVKRDGSSGPSPAEEGGRPSVSDSSAPQRLETTGAMSTTQDAAASTPMTKEDIRAAERLEERRQRGLRANLENTEATANMAASDWQSRPQSAFPFLRQRAVENEQTLDPSLVDWTSKYFPEDDEKTFMQPPQLRQRASPHAPGDAGVDEPSGNGGASREGTEQQEEAQRAPTPHARHRLQRSLRNHEDRRRATFDAEGAFYHVRRPSSDDSERAATPRPVRGSDIGRQGGAFDPRGEVEVVKVPWNVVSTAKQQGYTPGILRAKERLTRLSRGENPETIP